MISNRLEARHMFKGNQCAPPPKKNLQGDTHTHNQVCQKTLPANLILKKWQDSILSPVRWMGLWDGLLTLGAPPCIHAYCCRYPQLLNLLRLSASRQPSVAQLSGQVTKYKTFQVNPNDSSAPLGLLKSLASTYLTNATSIRCFWSGVYIPVCLRGFLGQIAHD